jgi:hypothetical protein
MTARSALVCAVLLPAWAAAQTQVPVPIPVPVPGQPGLPGQFGGNTIPSQTYFAAMRELYQGEYRDAENAFRYELNGSIKIGVATRWIDAICYHTMLGETYYQMGQPGPALEQFNQACAMFLQYPNWLLQVKFEDPRPDANRLRRAIPWGTSGRQFTLGNFSTQMSIMQGDLFSANRAVQRGGVVVQAQYWQINVVEFVRTTALAIRRRNELLGPLAVHDNITRALLGALPKSAPPNHWSNAWVDLLLGLSYVGQGKTDLALQRLARAERVAGRFDHPLTCVALLEQGRLAMEAGKTADAERLLAEASFSAFYYEDIGTIDEAFRLIALNRMAGPPQGPNPALEPAANWARRERLDQIFVRLNLAYAEELMRAGKWEAAAAAVKAGRARLRDAAAGRLGNWAQFLAARVLLHEGREKGMILLAQAVEQQAGMSTRNFQIDLANHRFDSSQLPPRTAVEIYLSLLDDPALADWVFRPLETLAVLKTPHGDAFDRWIAAQFAQKNPAMALEVADRAKRRYFHAMAPWGGRLIALRDTLEAPESRLSPGSRTIRGELLLKFPEYHALDQAGQRLQEEIRTRWVAGLDSEGERGLVKLWQDWAETLGRREMLLAGLALERIPTEMQFPPLRTTADSQSQLQPGQAVLVFHDTPGGLLGFLITSSAATHWNCGPSGRLNPLVAQFLRDVGNYDANHDLTAEELQSTAWIESGQKLYKALLDGSSIDPESLEELVIVPDGVVWYVPLTALPVTTEEKVIPLASTSRVRIAPTLGLAVGSAMPWRRVLHTAVVGSAIVPGADDAAKSAALASFRSTLPRSMELPDPLPVPAPVFGSLLDALVVLDEQAIDQSKPFAWSPLPADRSAPQNSLEEWLKLPQFGPQRMILPAVHTIAEQGGKAAKRRKATGAPGSELFLSTCGLMSSGAQTILLSRWRVGGQSTMEIVREFVQELPHTSAADAWQRSVQLAMEMPINPAEEPRVKSGKDDPPLTAAHPVFWSGYLLIDTGAPVIEDADEKPAEADLGAAVGANP